MTWVIQLGLTSAIGRMLLVQLPPAVYAKFTDVGRSGHTDYQITETTDGSSYWPLDISHATGKHYCEITQVQRQ